MQFPFKRTRQNNKSSSFACFLRFNPLRYLDHLPGKPVLNLSSDQNFPSKTYFRSASYSTPAPRTIRAAQGGWPAAISTCQYPMPFNDPWKRFKGPGRPSNAGWHLPLPPGFKNRPFAHPSPDLPEPAGGPKNGPKTRVYANTWHAYANHRHKTLPFTRLEAVLMDIKPIGRGLTVSAV